MPEFLRTVGERKLSAEDLMKLPAQRAEEGEALMTFKVPFRPTRSSRAPFRSCCASTRSMEGRAAATADPRRRDRRERPRAHARDGDLRKKLGKPDVLGATWLDDALVVIDSSLEGNEGRYCFTLGHEVGHWQLHRPLREMDKVTFPLFSREPGAKATAAIVCRDGQRDSAEIQADKLRRCCSCRRATCARR